MTIIRQVVITHGQDTEIIITTCRNN